MRELLATVAVHHPHEPWLAYQEVYLPPEQLTALALPAALNLHADVLHDGGVMFGTPSPLIRLEARSDRLPASWSWEIAQLPPLPDARPWQRPGWFAGAWQRLRNVQPDGTAQLLSTSDLGAVLMAGEGSQQVFLKVSTGQEVRVTAALARTRPQLLPDVLSTDLERGELITRFSGQTLNTVSDERAWTAAVEQLAHYHRSEGVDTQAQHAFANLLECGSALLRDQLGLREWGLTEQEIQRLIGALPELKRLWQRVSALHVPDGPVHGDVHPMNALWDGEQARLFDWSEAAVAHPLTDIGWFVGHCAGQRWPLVRAEPELAQRLASAYLNTLGLPGAQAELAAAVPLTLLQRAVVYDATYRKWPAPRPQYVPYYLRRMLSQLKTPSLPLVL